MVDKSPLEIRRMFGAIAPRYDLLNRLLSFSIDRLWRKRVRRELEPRLRPDALVLDLCTGTADLAFELATCRRVVGCDFCHRMLVLGAGKMRTAGPPHPVVFVEGDALRLPFRDGAFDAVTIAFGLRNLVDVQAGLTEIHRVLKTEGVLAVLEFSQPRRPIVRRLYGLYLGWVLPRLGDFLSGGGRAYSYLSNSVKEFPTPGEVEATLRQIGFAEARHHLLTGGIVALYLGRRPGAGERIESPVEESRTGLGSVSGPKAAR
jgi:demethylmenaquinone methyltransferase/2-methoxy-6-polyprenyl-1,4-benzoquinol methylase